MDAHVGTWKLVSCFMQDVETGEQKPVLRSMAPP